MRGEVHPAPPKPQDAHMPSEPGKQPPQETLAAGPGAPAAGLVGDAESEKMHPRAHPRMSMVRTISVIEFNDRGEPAGVSEAQSVDISRGGMAFVSRRLYHVGRNLLIEIRKPGECIPTFLYGTVRHSSYTPGKGHMVGLMLAVIPETQPILDFVAQRMRSAA